jgi:ectoine hydroxylase-related dioxygenase (phytanoyl-CoA dioxygenase family)
MRQFTREELDGLSVSVEAAAERARVECEDAGQVYELDGRRFVDLDHVTVQFEPAPNTGAIKVIEPVHEFDPALEQLISDDRLVQPMRSLLGTDRVALWTTKLNLKRPGVGTGFGWHQDSPYWMHDCDDVDRLPNVMLALDEATEANGCLRVVPGSHLEGCLPGTDDDTQLGGFYTDSRRFDARLQKALAVPAGSLIFFDPHLVHGSLANRSGLPRRALVLTYQPGGRPSLKSRLVIGV